MSKKRKNAWQGVSIVILVVILGTFFYVNLKGEDHDDMSETKTVSRFSKLRALMPMSPLEWTDTQVPINIIEGVFFGNPNDLDTPVILSQKGEYEKIKVEESGEPLVEFGSIKNPRIKHISEFDPNYHRYIKDGPESVYMRTGVREALIKMLDYLPKNIGIIYTEGYISPNTYLKRLQDYYDDQYFESESIPPDQRYKVISILLPKSFLTGGTVSIALFDIDKNEMIELDNTKEMGFRNHTFSPDATEEHRKNRLILLEAAIKAGFVNYGMMWWCFTINEKIHAFANYKNTCQYGYIDFDINTKQQKPYVFPEESEILKHLEDNKAPVQPAQNPDIKIPQNLIDPVSKEEKEVYQTLVDSKKQDGESGQKIITTDLPSGPAIVETPKKDASTTKKVQRTTSEKQLQREGLQPKRTNSNEKIQSKTGKA